MMNLPATPPTKSEETELEPATLETNQNVENQHDSVDCDPGDLDIHCSNPDCNITESELGCELFQCFRSSKCAAVYCSRTCGSRHWTAHRSSCGKPT